MLRGRPVRRLLLVIILWSCVDQPTGPGHYDPATLTLRLALPPATPAIWFPRGDTLHVMVRRAGRPAPIAESRVVIADVLEERIQVPIASSVERFVATAEVVIGEQIFFLAFDAVQLRAGQDTTIEMEAQYVGPAASAASVSIVPRDSTLRRSDTTSFDVVALDSLGQAISNVPLRFESRRPLLVVVSDSGIAAAASDAPTDTARVIAWTPTGVTNSTLFRIVPSGGGIPVTTEVIAFISTRDGRRELYMMNGDGSGAQRLTDTPEDEYSPAWSPDRAEIAFEREIGGERQIVVLDVGAGQERQLTTSGGNTGPRWSPDGTLIAFTSTRAGSREVWVMAPDGGAQRRLMDPAGAEDTFADWAPDGSAFAFVRQAPGSSEPALHRANADGSGAEPYAGDGPVPAHQARWSPLGGELLATRLTRGSFSLASRPGVAGGITLHLPRPTSADMHFGFAGSAHEFVFESEAGGTAGIHRGDTTTAWTRLSPADIAEFEPDHVWPSAPMYVTAVTIAPAGATLTSDEATQRFTVTVTTATGGSVSVPISWFAGSDGRLYATTQGDAVEVIAVAVGTARVTATYAGWRSDTAEVVIAPATGPMARRLALSVGSELFTMRGDGTDTVRLTALDGSTDSDPAWSPDGARIAWRSTAGGSNDIWVMNADGTGAQRLTSDAASDGQPSWSPDGRRLAFHSAPAGGGGAAIWLMDADGTNRVQLTSGGNDLDPAWSPDGSLLAFVRLTGASSTLQVIPLAGGAPRVVPTSAGRVRYPAWAPDGSMLYYSVAPAGELSRIARVPFPAGTEVQLTTGRGPFTLGLGGDFEPSVAEDGTITFWSFRHSFSFGQQMVMRADGSAQSGLLPVTDVSGIGAWRPDAPPRYAATVAIGGDVATPLTAGTTRALTASAMDQSGAAIAPIGGFHWTALDPAVATVDAAGLVSAVAPGTARIVATTGVAMPDTVSLTISPAGSGGPVTRTWAGGASGGATDWFVAANWMPAGVPSAQDTVIVAAAASQPVLTGNAEVARLTIDGAGASLTLNGHTLTSAEDVRTGPTGGTIVMQNPADTLRVGDDAVFGGANTAGLLTAGVLIVGGDVEQVLTSGNEAAFAPSGTHRTVLAGGGDQEIRFATPDGDAATSSYFHHLEVVKAAGEVHFLTNAHVRGVMRVGSPTRVYKPFYVGLTVDDSLVTAAGSDLALEGELRLGGGMAVGGAFMAEQTTLFGTNQVLQPGLAYDQVTINGTVRLAGATHTTGDVEIVPAIAGGIAELRIDGHTLTIDDDLQIGPDGGALVMQHPADSVIVLDGVEFAGAASTGLLTAGVLIVGGDFDQLASAAGGATFAPSGSHRTILRRQADPPRVTFENGAAGATESFFHHLEIASDTVELNSRVTVAGILTVNPTVRLVVLGVQEPLVAFGADVRRLRTSDVPLEIGPGPLLRFDSVSTGRANYSAPQLTVRHAGAASPFAFTGLAFNTDANAGTFIHAIDVAPGDGVPLVIDLMDADPPDGSAHTITEGGAIVNWRSSAVGITRTWVGGSFSTGWHEPGNWLPAGEPAINDTVIIVPAATQPDLFGRATVAKLTIAGSGARLRLNNAHLTVRGDFTTGPNGGAVVMQNPTDTLRVEGAAVFSGDDTIGLLTDGVLLLAGNFHQQYIGSNWAGFAPSGAHRTVLIGSSAQNLRFDSPAGAPTQRSFFNHLMVDKTAGNVWVSSDVVVMGRLELASSAVLRDLEKHLTVHDSLVTSSGTEIRIDGWLHLGGGMDVGGAFGATTTDFFGTDQVIQPGLPYSNIDVTGRARFVGPTQLNGALHVGNRRDASGAVVRGDIALNGQSVTVAHDLATLPNGGTVTMTSAADTLRVLGSAWFAGDVTGGTLTNGTLIIGGDFRQQYIGSNWASFAPSGDHRTILAGSSPQSILFDSPDGAPTQRSHFHHLTVTNPSTVSLAGRTYVNGDFALSSSGSLDGAATLVVLGALSTSSGSTLGPARVDAAGAVAIAGTFAADTIEYRGTTQTVQAGLPYRHVIVGGTTMLGGATTASGSVVVRPWTSGVQSDLDLAGQQLSVAGDFRTGPNGGSLTMRSAADLLIIGGNATFSGAVTGGRLTAGEIRLAGDFRQQYIGSNWASFAPSGTHRTVLTGGAPQSVHFDSPDGAPTQRSFFQDLVLSGAGGITLASRAYVDGVLRVTAPTAPVIAGNGSDLIAAGVDVPRLTLDNTPFSIGAGPITRFDSVTFQGYSSAATQLTVRHPGAATAFDFVGLRFLVTPTTGWYVSARDVASANGLPLTINLVGAQATDGPAHTQTFDGAVVNWPVTSAASASETSLPPVRVANP